MIRYAQVAARLATAGYVDDDVLVALFAFAAQRPADAAVRAIAAAAGGLAAHGLTTPARLAEFLAQTAHETGGYRRFEENLRYSAERLAQVWPARFRGPNALAKRLAGRPEAIANCVYARPEEGNCRPGDGWLYRGRGMLQLTFRNNYRAAGQRLGLDLEARPERAADPATSLAIALDFWTRAGVNACCDAGDFRGARGLTNCGTARPKGMPIGLADVAARRERLLAVLG